MGSEKDYDRILKLVLPTNPKEPGQYDERDFIYNADDWELKRLTPDGGFPFKVGTTHPIFVLDSNDLKLNVCPCSSSQEINNSNYRYIERGCIRRNVPNREKTYLIEDKSFPMPNDYFFLKDLKYQGNVPEKSIKNPKNT